MTATTAEPLRIDGLVNIRDLGGLGTGDGRAIGPRRVIRSDNPRGLTHQGQDELATVVAPRLVIDLRMSEEVAGQPYLLTTSDARVVNLPMVPQSGVTQAQIDGGAAGSLLEDYLLQLDVNASSITRALRLASDPANRPTLVHCTAGKDRTGIVVALLLDILGVDHETIVADYHVTAANMAPILERIRAAQVYQDNGLATAPEWIFAAEQATMRGFLLALTEQHGGAEQYALAHGMTAAEIHDLRQGVLD